MIYLLYECYIGHCPLPSVGLYLIYTRRRLEYEGGGEGGEWFLPNGTVPFSRPELPNGCN
jgi:hypothetical protein